VVFTVAWVVSSLRQASHSAARVQLSGLAAEDARDPQIMVAAWESTGAAARQTAGAEVANERLGSDEGQQHQGKSAIAALKVLPVTGGPPRSAGAPRWAQISRFGAVPTSAAGRPSGRAPCIGF
jgi:hypothetical protein